MARNELPSEGSGIKAVWDGLEARSDGWSAHSVMRAGVSNITDYEFGVASTPLESQTPKIEHALRNNPGRPFFFPPGNYRLDTQLDVKFENSIVLAPGARLYAGRPMKVLINVDNGAVHADRFAENCALSGYGELDGNLLAGTVLRINAVLRFSIEGLTLTDGIHRGLLADEHGAELHVRNLRVRNTSHRNVRDNIGIESKMNDARFANVSMRDLTIGVWDRGTNYWFDIHPWLGESAQVAARYADSVAFVLQGNSVLMLPYADTYRYAFRTQAEAGYVRARIIAPEFYLNPGNLTSELAAAYPGAVLDITDAGASVAFCDGLLRGHPEVPANFVQGNTSRLSAEGNISPGELNGFAEFKRGVIMGLTPFVPTLFGSDAMGSQSYVLQHGVMEVRDGVVTYQFKVRATLGADIAGNLRIGGLPMPTNVNSVNMGSGGVLTRVTGGLVCDAVIGANGTTAPLAAVPISAVGGAEVVAPDFANREVELWGEIESTFDFPV